MSLAIVLSIVFMVLKLTHVIAWSWFYVILPVLVGAALQAVTFLYVVKKVTGRFGGLFGS